MYDSFVLYPMQMLCAEMNQRHLLSSPVCSMQSSLACFVTGQSQHGLFVVCVILLLFSCRCLIKNVYAKTVMFFMRLEFFFVIQIFLLAPQENVRSYIGR